MLTINRAMFCLLSPLCIDPQREYSLVTKYGLQSQPAIWVCVCVCVCAYSCLPGAGLTQSSKDARNCPSPQPLDSVADSSTKAKGSIRKSFIE